jgi:hypothetical protein
MQEMQEMSGTVTEWLKPNQPLAIWWQRNYPGLRQVSRDLAARVVAACTISTTPTTNRTSDRLQSDSPNIPSIPVDTPGLRYYDYGLLGGAIDYRMRMEFSPQWGGDPARSAFTRAWAGKRGSLAHAAAGLLADCAPALSQAALHEAHRTHKSHEVRERDMHLAQSLPALVRLLEEWACRVDDLAPWDWKGTNGTYAATQREESWLLDYCIVLAELDNFYRTFGARFDFTPLLSPSGYRSAMYASGRLVRPSFWGVGASGAFGTDASGSRPGAGDIGGVEGVVRQRAAAARIVGELERSWPIFAYLRRTPNLTLDDLASVASEAGRMGLSRGIRGSRGLERERLLLLRRDLTAQLALWHRNPARKGAQPPPVVAANPTFAGSTRLPADGDLIVRSKEGTSYLIDFKSAKRIEPAGMLVVLRQVLTYALMDEGDEYEIRRVGFYFTRYGLWAHWSLQELLDMGIGEADPEHSKPLDWHQQALRRMFLDLRQPQALDVATPRR